ncbi:MAG TPA: histidine phosphatase family protein [Ktedonobacterales bacterium]
MSTPDSPETSPFPSRKNGATELYLIRHGDALPGGDEIVPGGTYDDQPLSLLGRQQAEALRARFAAFPFDAIYSSPYRRARETAAPLAQMQGLEVLIEPEIREIRLGQVGNGLPKGVSPDEYAAALRARLDEIVRRVAATGYWSSIAGSEPSAEFRARVTAAIDGLAARHAGQRVALFSHGGVINTYLAVTLGLERDFFFPAVNTSIHVVRVKGDTRVLLGLNDICHLRDAGLLRFTD